MSICSPVHVELPENQFLADLLTDEVKQGNTLIVAPTGAGKSTYFMEKLRLAAEAQDKRLLILSPLTAQVMQLEVKYPSSEYPICFMYGTDQPTTSFEGKHIVATYDKFARLRYDLSAEQRKKYILVVDEYHKLYSAGHFRDAALNPILKALQRKYFEQNLFFTATFTQHLATHLPHPIHYYQKIIQAQSLVRSLSIINYQLAWSYHWLKAVEKRLSIVAAQYAVGHSRQTILVRLNAVNACRQAERYLSELGYKVLTICRETAASAPVRDTILNERLSTDFDVILTTSLLDEAVNLNNAPGEIDSVHLINATASPEEIVQFMGRLRRSTPPCFLHLQHGIPHECQPEDLQKNHIDCISKIEQFHDHMKAAAASLASAVSLLAKDNKVSGKNNVSHAVTKLNATFKSICGCNVLECDKDRVSINVAGVSAAACRVDQSDVYHDAAYLEYRLKQLSPDLQIQHVCSNAPQVEAVNVAFDLIKKGIQIDREYAIEIAMGHFLESMSRLSPMAAGSPLKYYGAKMLERIKSINDIGQIIPMAYSHPLVSSIYSDILWLTQYVDNLDCIYQIIKANYTSMVINTALKRQQDAIIQALMQHIERHVTDLQEKCVGKALPIRINGDTAKSLLEISMLQVDKTMPLAEVLRNQPIKGVKVIEDKQGLRFEITPSKALLFIAQNFNIKVINSHKAGSRKLVEFYGFGWGGYHYHDVNPSSADLKFKHGEKMYHAKTGSPVSHMTIEDLYKL